jgi:hypothetical protein
MMLAPHWTIGHHDIPTMHWNPGKREVSCTIGPRLRKIIYRSWG